MTVFLLAQAGIPFTSGFFAKFYAIDAVVGRHADWIAVVAMLTGAVAAFLYLRIVVAMYLGPADEVPATPRLSVPFGSKLAIGICFVVTLGVGLAPETVVSLTEHGRPDLVEAPAPTPPRPGRPPVPAVEPVVERRFPESSQASLGSDDDAVLGIRTPIPDGRPDGRPGIGADRHPARRGRTGRPA